jgi:hypothetical protein
MWRTATSPVGRHSVQETPLYYSCLTETQLIHDITDLSGNTMAALPAVVCVHAVHVADGEIACGYTRQAGDIAEPDRDWFDVRPGDVPCEACDKATHGNQ